MKEERIVEILSMVDEKYVEEAAPAQKRKASYVWGRWAVAAACVLGISWFGYSQLKVPEPTPQLEGMGVTATPVPTSAPEAEPTDTPISEPTPMPTAVPDDVVVSPKDGLPLLNVGLNDGGMGFEGMMFYDISESSSASPWTKEIELKTLPVYRNLAYTKGGSGVEIWYSDEELYVRAEEVADLLDVEILSVEYERVSEENIGAFDKEGSYMIQAKTSQGDIRVDGNGRVWIYFEPAIEIPEEYSFTRRDTPTEEAYETIYYLLEQYSDLCAWEQYTVDTWGDYSYSGEYSREYDAFKTGASLEEGILNYHFSRISFIPDWEGRLRMIRFCNQLDCTEELGRYPIISRETAQSLLLNGDYLTSVPKEYLSDGKVKEEAIAKVELIYRHSALEEVFMPYYRFYVELPKIDDMSMAEGLKCYGAFYVPAVSGEYLVNFPMWDGNIN